MSTLHLARTSVPYLNQAFTNIVNPHRQITIIVNPLRWNQQLFYIISFPEATSYDNYAYISSVTENAYFKIPYHQIKVTDAHRKSFRSLIRNLQALGSRKYIAEIAQTYKMAYPSVNLSEISWFVCLI